MFIIYRTDLRRRIEWDRTASLKCAIAGLLMYRAGHPEKTFDLVRA